MELSEADRTAIRQFATAMLRSMAAGNYSGVYRMGGAVTASWGAAGIGYLLILWSMEVVDCAPAEVRNPFGKIRPESVVSAPDFAEMIRRIRSNYADATARGITIPHSPSDPDRTAILNHVAAYLNAVQREDHAAGRLVLQDLQKGPQLDFDAMREVILTMAARFSPVVER